MGHGSKSGKSSSSAKNACYLMPARKKVEAKKKKYRKKEACHVAFEAAYK